MTNYKIYLTNDVKANSIIVEANRYDVNEITTQFFKNTYTPAGRVNGKELVFEVFNKNVVFIKKM